MHVQSEKCSLGSNVVHGIYGAKVLVRSIEETLSRNLESIAHLLGTVLALPGNRAYL